MDSTFFVCRLNLHVFRTVDRGINWTSGFFFSWCHWGKFTFTQSLDTLQVIDFHTQPQLCERESSPKSRYLTGGRLSWESLDTLQVVDFLHDIFIYILYEKYDVLFYMAMWLTITVWIVIIFSVQQREKRKENSTRYQRREGFGNSMDPSVFPIWRLYGKGFKVTGFWVMQTDQSFTKRWTMTLPPGYSKKRWCLESECMCVCVFKIQ